MPDSPFSAVEPSRRNSARNRNAIRVGFLVSALVHAALLFGWRTSEPAASGSLAAGPRAGDFRAAPGGGELLAIAIAAPRPIEIPAPPARRLRLVDPDVAMERPEELVLTAELMGPSGGAATPANSAGPGLDGADGLGDGGSNPDGRNRRTDPSPRSIIPVWDAPRDVRGMRVTVRVELDARGEPTGQITIEPSLPNSGFDRRLRKELLSMDYIPASSGGFAVADWAEMTFTF